MFDQNQMQLNELHNALNGNKATLIMTSPRIMRNNVIRPLMYDFNDGLVSDISDRIECKRTGRTGSLNTMTKNMVSAVMPRSNGIPLDTSYLSTLWSFVLIINIEGSSHYTRNSVKGPGQRFIAIGYFTDEPISSLSIGLSTPAINGNCFMQFTHCTRINTHNEITNNGMIDKRILSSDVDTIMPHTQSHYEDNLYSIRPGDYLKNVGGDSSELITSFGINSISANKNNAIVNSYENNPKHHMDQIINSVDTAVAYSDEDTIQSPLTSGSLNNSFDNFIETARGSFISSAIAHIQTAVDISKPMSLNELQRMFPDINIIPVEIPSNGICEERPQSLISKQNIMSSLVVDAINSIIIHCGISEIIFRYNSWMNDVTPGQGVWDISQVFELVPGNEKTIISALNKFKYMIERDVFPIIRAEGGEFDLHARFDATGETFVDLKFLDETSDDGFYVHHNRLGGIVSPLLGTMDDITHNNNELHKLFTLSAAQSGYINNTNNMDNFQPNDYPGWDDEGGNILFPKHF